MNANILVGGIGFPEGPRWHKDRLWFSDMQGFTIYALDMDGNLEVMLKTKFSPSGLGWLPNDDLLYVSMNDCKLMRYDGQKTEVFSDLSGLVQHPCNDMVVDKDGYAYIGNFGFDMAYAEEPVGTILIGVSPDGEAKAVADDLYFPNGVVIANGGKTLVVAETFGSRLTAFDIAPDKSLSNRRVWADLEGYMPDGIALDKTGGIWVASAIHDYVIRVEEHGAITDRVQVSQKVFACAIGGKDNNTLFACTSKLGWPGEAIARKIGKIESIELP